MAEGEALVYGTDEFEAMERAGLAVAGKTGFVLVAGGLGERLGFNDIKVMLCCVTAYYLTMSITAVTVLLAWVDRSLFVRCA
jgi:UDP-N-acetylglucosamine pyrophosphorylase